MKYLLIVSLLITAFGSQAQSSQHNQANQATRKRSSVTSTEGKENNPKTVYSSSEENNAYENSPSIVNQYQISDPTLKALNEQALGSTVKVSKSGVVGMPKHNYGFADGHIIFHTNNSTTFGTSTGSGAVGTGSSPGSMGTMGPGTGLNGKSPYAGAGMFGIGTQGTINQASLIKKQPGFIKQ